MPENPNPPMYPGASDQGHEIRGHAIEHVHTPACDPHFGLAEARAAAEAFKAAYPELMTLIHTTPPRKDT